VICRLGYSAVMDIEPSSSHSHNRVSRVSGRAHGSGVDAALCARRILGCAGRFELFVWGGTVPMEGMRRPSR
jgi:hypothetical protein